MLSKLIDASYGRNILQTIEGKFFFKCVTTELCFSNVTLVVYEENPTKLLSGIFLDSMLFFRHLYNSSTVVRLVSGIQKNLVVLLDDLTYVPHRLHVPSYYILVSIHVIFTNCTECVFIPISLIS